MSLNNNPITAPLPNNRIGSDWRAVLTLKDNGVAVDWSTLDIEQIFMLSESQAFAFAGLCEASVDAEDPTRLNVVWKADKQLFQGIHRIVAQVALEGFEKTYDKRAVNIVPLSDSEEDVYPDDPTEVELEVVEVDTSIMTAILRACQEATKEATEVADTAAENEIARVAAEASRISAEAGRVAAESARATAESGRSSAESARATAEGARATAESSRASAESERAEAEVARDNAEANRAYDERARQIAEDTRQRQEALRQQSEIARDDKMFEFTRRMNENQELIDEYTITEQEREEAELSRQTAESSREAAEGQRALAFQAAEAERSQIFASKEAERDAANEAALNAASKLSELDVQINGEPSEIEIAPVKVSEPGYYTGRVGETIGFTSSNGYYYETIDLGNYVGKTLKVTMVSTATSTTRRTAICNADGVIVALFGEGDFANGAVFERVIESGWNLRISHSLIASISVNVKIVGEESDSIVKDIADLKESVEGLTEGLNDATDNISLIGKKVNGSTTQEVIPVGVGVLGYYTGRVGEIIGSTSSSGVKFAPIDLRDYAGSTISISLDVKSASTSTTRRTAICDANGKILALRGDGDFSDGSSWDVVVEEGQFLYISYNPSNFTNPVVITTKYVKGLDEQIKDITAKIEKSFIPVQISCDSNSQVTNNNFKVCPFVNAPSSVISGVGNSIISVNVDTSGLTPKDVISFGFLASFDFQDAASISLNGTNIEVAEDYRETASGKLYHIDGDSFNRYNMYADGDTSTLTINVTAASGIEWKLLIANKVVINDCMDVTPICLCYDGGGWDGKMVFNGEQISLWTLHEILGLPYTICIDPNTMTFDTFHPIVKEHIASGFATTMLRHVPYTIGGDKQQPTEMQLVNKIEDEFNLAEFSTAKACVLGQHHFDRKIRRCMTKAGVKALRIQAYMQGYQGQISRMPNDAEIMCTNSAAVNNAMSATAIPFKFPLIAFAHGIGIPPEGATGYADSTGTITPATFVRLKELQDRGDVAVLNINDWIAKCGF